MRPFAATPSLDKVIAQSGTLALEDEPEQETQAPGAAKDSS